MKRVFPELFEDIDILPVDDYVGQLFHTRMYFFNKPLEWRIFNWMLSSGARLSNAEKQKAVVVGHRYGGPEAAAAGIVDAAAPLESLTDGVVERVAAVASTAGDNLALIKKQLYPEIAAIAGG